MRRRAAPGASIRTIEKSLVPPPKSATSNVAGSVKLLCRANIDYGGDECRHACAPALHLLAQLPPPGEQLRGAHAMPPGDRADRLLPGEALGQDRCLHLRRPIPPSPRPGEHLEARYTARASIIIWHRHSTSALHPIRERRLDAVLQARKVGPRPRLPQSGKAETNALALRRFPQPRRKPAFLALQHIVQHDIVGAAMHVKGCNSFG